MYGYYFMVQLFVVMLIFMTLGNLPTYGEYANLFGPPTKGVPGILILLVISTVLNVYYLFPVL